MIKSYWLTQGFEMMETIVDVENCLQVIPKLHFTYLYLPVLYYVFS
jgi:hypothetical protein